MMSLVVGGLLISLAATSCGSDDKGADAAPPAPSATTALTTPAGSSGGTDVVAAAQSVVDAALLTDKTYPKPPGAFVPGKHTGAVIAQGFLLPVHIPMAAEAIAAYKAMGWDTVPAIDGKLNPAVYGAALDRLTQQKVDAVAFISTPLSAIKPAVQRALAAGMAITCIMCDDNPDILALGVKNAGVDFKEQGKIAAAAIIARTKGKAKVIVTDEPSQPAVVARVAGMLEEFKTCPECKVETLTIPAASSTLPGPPIWTAALTKNPAGGGLTDAVAYYDGLALTMSKALQQQGRTDIKITGFDADAPAVAEIAAGKPVAADLASPFPYLTWSAVDIAARTVTKNPVWDAAQAPSTLLTTANAGDYKDFPAPAGDWRAAFKALWTQS
jgi:ABC-type sugar transport system substrate-binding protein